MNHQQFKKAVKYLIHEHKITNDIPMPEGYPRHFFTVCLAADQDEALFTGTQESCEDYVNGIAHAYWMAAR